MSYLAYKDFPALLWTMRLAINTFEVLVLMDPGEERDRHLVNVSDVVMAYADEIERRAELAEVMATC